MSRVLAIEAGSLARRGVSSADRLHRRVARAEAEVSGFEHLIASIRNDAKDRHVVAAAVRAGAQVFTTSHVRDFTPLPDGLEAQSPDELLPNLFDLDPDALVDVLRERAADLQRPPVAVGDLLARLVLVAPDFVAAVHAHTGGPPVATR